MPPCSPPPSPRLPLLNLIPHYKVPLVPMNYAGERHLVAKLFPGKPVAPSAKTDAFCGFADAKH